MSKAYLKTASRSLISGFLSSARAFPERLALHVAGINYTYRSLATKMVAVANQLLNCLEKDEALVGVFAYRSFPMYSGILAVLYSGRGYVPLNPSFPRERVAHLINRSQVRTIVVDRVLLPSLEAILEKGSPIKVVIVSGGGDEFDEYKNISAGCGAISGTLTKGVALDEPQVLPNEVAYLLFTSGSTGEPKGVPISHLNVTSFIDQVLRKYNFTADDRFSQTFDFSFDLSVFDMFVAWSVGAGLYCLAKSDILNPKPFIQRHRLTVWFSVPSSVVTMSHLGLLDSGVFPELRLSLFCGEALLQSTANEWARAAPFSEIYNLYGPTEATIAFTWQEIIVGGKSDFVPIGTPIPGNAVAVIDENFNLVAEGEVGELCLAGSQLTTGYWNDDKTSASRFVSLDLPLIDQANRWYLTGDLVRWTGNECGLEFISRKDDQVKIGGYRVELGEIESVVRTFSKSINVAAVAYESLVASILQIALFVVGNDVDEGVIRLWCRDRLPSYMIPNKIIFLDALPLNVNGKIDKGMLKKLANKVV